MINHKFIDWKNDNPFHNCNHFPSELRLLIIGSSGKGKTTTLLNLLLNKCSIHNKYFLDYKTLVLVSPSLAQNKYKVLIKAIQSKLSRQQILTFFDERDNLIISDIDKVKRANDDKNFKGDLTIVTFNNPKNIPSPDDLNKKYKKNLICFDDSMTLSQVLIEQYFSFGRALGINIIYISQAFTKTEKSTIRTQANFYIFFKQTQRDIKVVIYPEIIGTDMDKDQFIELSKNAWNSNFDFISLNCDTREYTVNLNEILDYKMKASNEMKKYLDEAVEARNAQLDNISAKKGNIYSSNLLKETTEKIFSPITEKGTEFAKEQRGNINKSEENVLKELAGLSNKINPIVKEKEDELAAKELTKLNLSEDVTEKIFEEYYNARDDENFGIVKKENYYIFGINNIDATIDNFKFNYKIHFDFEKQLVNIEKEDSLIDSIPLSQKLLILLTKENFSHIEDGILKYYYKIIKECLRDGILNLYKWGTGTDPERIKVKKILNENPKYKKFIYPHLKECKIARGLKSYQEMSKEKIIIPSDANDQLQRIFILLGALKSGTNSDSILKELTSLLDELLKNNLITKEIYKVLYYRAKRFHLINSKR